MISTRSTRRRGSGRRLQVQAPRHQEKAKETRMYHILQARVLRIRAMPAKQGKVPRQPSVGTITADGATVARSSASLTTLAASVEKKGTKHPTTNVALGVQEARPRMQGKAARLKRRKAQGKEKARANTKTRDSADLGKRAFPSYPDVCRHAQRMS